jgi:hypothetical protein
MDRETLEKEIIELLKKEKGKKEISNDLGFRLLVYGVLYGFNKPIDKKRGNHANKENFSH